MALTEAVAEEFSALWLKHFPSNNSKIRVVGYLGGGAAGYVFKVQINHKAYALKMAS